MVTEPDELEAWPEPDPLSATTLFWDGLVMRSIRIGQYARPTHGYEPTCEAAMVAFTKSWRRE